MRSEHLEYFLETAKCKSMNQAAKKLFMTQSSLSVAIGSLEKELGFLLLERTNAGVILTDKGKKVFEETQIVLNYINGWKQMVNGKEKIGIVSIPTLCSAVLPRVIYGLKYDYPNLDVMLYPAYWSDILDVMQNNQYQIGIVALKPEDRKIYFNNLNCQRYKYKKIRTGGYNLLINADNYLAQKEQICLRDLKELTLAIHYSTRRYHYDEILTGEYFSHIIKQGSDDSIMYMLENNLAAALNVDIALFDMTQIRHGSVKNMEIHDYPMPLEYYLVYSTEKYLSETITTVLQKIEKVFMA